MCLIICFYRQQAISQGNAAGTTIDSSSAQQSMQNSLNIVGNCQPSGLNKLPVKDTMNDKLNVVSPMLQQPLIVPNYEHVFEEHTNVDDNFRYSLFHDFDHTDKIESCDNSVFSEVGEHKSKEENINESIGKNNDLEQATAHCLLTMANKRIENHELHDETNTMECVSG